GIDVQVQGNDSHTLVLSANAPEGITAQAMQVALRMAQYNNTSQNPDTTQRVIEVSVKDVQGAGIGATTTIGITAVNDAPVFNGSLDADVIEGSVASLKGVLISTDADSQPGDVLYVVTARPDNGVVFRELPDGTREVIDVVVDEPLDPAQIAALKDGKGYFT